MRSGAGKSPADKLTVEWLRRWQAQRIETAAPAIEEAHQKLRLAEKRLTEKERSAVSGAGSDHDANLARLERNSIRDTMPKSPRILVDDAIVDALLAVAAASGLEARREAMFTGEPINVTERRAVLHTALRRPRTDTLVVDGQDVIADVHATLDRVYAFADRVRSGEWVGVTGKPIARSE